MMIEFLVGMIDRGAGIFLIAALLAWLLGWPDAAEVYANLAALTLGLALGRRWRDGIDKN